jgi:hypothetical protein
MNLDDLNVGDAITVKQSKEEQMVNSNPFMMPDGY